MNGTINMTRQSDPVVGRVVQTALMFRCLFYLCIPNQSDHPFSTVTHFYLTLNVPHLTDCVTTVGLIVVFVSLSPPPPVGLLHLSLHHYPLSLHGLIF